MKLDPAKVREKITSKSKAIITQSLWRALLVIIHEFAAITAEKGIPVITTRHTRWEPKYEDAGIGGRGLASCLQLPEQ